MFGDKAFLWRGLRRIHRFCSVCHKQIVKLTLGLFFLLGLMIWLAWFRISPFYTELLTPLSIGPRVIDRGDWSQLLLAVNRQIAYFTDDQHSHTTPVHPHFTKERQLKGLIELKKFLEQTTKDTHPGQLADFIQKNYILYLAQGKKNDGLSLLTGYYLPVLSGSYTPTARYRFPLYKKPWNLYPLNLKQFRHDLPNFSLRGLLTDQGLIPAYTRAEIDLEGKLSGQGLELVYVDSYLDQFFLHIQGSGVVDLPDGKRMALNYHDKNGRPYVAIGGLLVKQGWLESKDLSMQSIKDFLSVHPELEQSLLMRNESYVFFREADLDLFPLGDIEVPLTAERSMASDHGIFPKGSIAWVSTTVHTPEGIKPFQRLVLDQDTGGAIKGGGHFDLFFGLGQTAAFKAGKQKELGQVYYLLWRD